MQTFVRAVVIIAAAALVLTIATVLVFL